MPFYFVATRSSTKSFINPPSVWPTRYSAVRSLFFFFFTEQKRILKLVCESPSQLCTYTRLRHVAIYLIVYLVHIRCPLSAKHRTRNASYVMAPRTYTTVRDHVPLWSRVRSRYECVFNTESRAYYNRSC